MAAALMAAVLAAMPIVSRAAEDAATNAPVVIAPAVPAAPVMTPPPVVAPPEMPATNEPAKPKKPRTSLVFSGKVVDVDTNAMTVTIGKHTFDITSETRITKNGEPAILSELAMGDKVGVSYKKAGDKLDAMTINDGKKPANEKKQ
jgi:hypothetical protein